MLGNKQGQNTLDYTILFAAVITVLVVFLTREDGGFRDRLDQSLDDSSSTMTTVSQRLADMFN